MRIEPCSAELSDCIGAVSQAVLAYNEFGKDTEMMVQVNTLALCCT